MLNARTRGAGGWLLAATMALAWPGTGRGQEIDSLVGTRVVTRRGAVLRIDDQPVETEKLRRVYQVERTADAWVRLTSEDVSGWARVADVVPCEQAIEYFTSELNAHPDAGWAYAMRGLLYEEMNEPQIALADYNEAIRLDPKDAQAYLRRGDLRAGLRKSYDRAVADYGEAIKIDPKLAAAHLRRGDALRAMQEYDRALADYEEAIKIDPKDVRGYHGRGLARLGKGDAGGGIDDLNEVLRVSPSDPVALLNRGNAWAEKREYDRALADYDEAIRLDPKYALAYNNRGLVWKAKKEYDRAVSDHNVAIRIDPGDATSFLYRGLAWKKSGEYERALADYSQAIQLNPDFAEAYNGRAWLQATCPADQYRDGKSAYESAIRACELTGWSAARDLDTLAAAYAESRDFTRAVEWQEKALRLAADAEKEEYAARLDLYRGKKPFRDAPGS
jgi:tetratricopeptide (TPR) repeat protein